MPELILYEQARAALATCCRCDEVKDMRDKAEALAAYARQAKDTELVKMATEIKVRAERRLGELLIRAVSTGQRASRLSNLKHVNSSKSHDTTSIPRPTLAAIGITRDESSRWQKLAAMPDDRFETALARAQESTGRVTTSFMLRQASASHKPRHKGRPKKGPLADASRAELKALIDKRPVSMLTTYARLLLTAIRVQDDFTADERTLLAQVADSIKGIAPLPIGGACEDGK